MLTVFDASVKKRPERKASAPETPLPDEELIKAVSRLMQQKRSSLARLQQNVAPKHAEAHLNDN